MAPAGDSSALEGLGLTPKQREKIRAIREETRQANAPLRDQARQLMGGRMYRDLTPTEQDSLRPKLEPIRQAMMANVRKGRYQIEAILTAEQREKFHQLMGRGEAPGGPPEN
jgi:Spy/CpxP family protein refolding chaperone